eukprot:scaffold2858_cov659-Pavlova_lutheri.AAC.37
MDPKPKRGFGESKAAKKKRGRGGERKETIGKTWMERPTHHRSRRTGIKDAFPEPMERRGSTLRTKERQ